MASRQVKFELIADASQLPEGFGQVVTESNKAAQGLTKLHRSGADVEKVLDELAQSGSDDFRMLVGVLRAAGAPIEQIKEQLAAFHRDEVASVRDRIAIRKRLIEIEQQSADALVKANQQAAQAERELATEARRAAKEEAQAANAAQHAATAQSVALSNAADQSRRFADATFHLASGMVATATNFEQQRVKLTALYGDAGKAREEFAKFVDYAAKTPFTVPGVVDAAIKIRSFKQDVDKLLPIAAEMASRFGTDIPEAALALSKAMSGTHSGVKILMETFGVSRETLRQYGADIDAAGEVHLQTKENVEHLRAAILKLAQTEWSGGIELQADTLKTRFSNLGDAVEKLQDKLMQGVAPALKGLAGAATEAVDAAGSLNSGVLEFGGALAAGITGAAGLVAGAAGLKLGLTALSGATGIAAQATVAATAAGEGLVAAQAAGAAAATAATLSLAAWTAGLALAAAGVIYMVAKLHELKELQEQATKDAVNDLTALQAVYKANHQWAGKSADELRKMGVTQADATQVIAGLKVQIDELGKAGRDANDPVIKSLKAQIEQWRQVGVAIGDVKNHTTAAEQAAKKSAEESAAAFTKYQTDVQLGAYKTKKTQLEALDAIAERARRAGPLLSGPDAKANADLLTKLAIERHHLQVQIENETTSARKKALSERVKDSLEALAEERSGGELTHRQEIARLQTLLKMHGLTGEEIRQIKRQLRQAEKADREGALKDELADIKQRVKAHAMTAEQEETALRRLLATHRLTAAERRSIEAELTDLIQQNVQKRLDADLKAMELQKKGHKLTVDQEIAGLEKILATHKDISEEKRNALRLQIEGLKTDKDEHAKRGEKEVSDLRQAALDREIDGLKERNAKGENVDAQIKQRIHDRYQMERKEVQAAIDEERRRYGDSAQLQEKLKLKLEALATQEKKAVDDVSKARADAANKAIRDLERVEAKQLGILKFKGGQVYGSVQEAFGESKGFSIEDQGAAPAESGTGRPAAPTPADVAALEAAAYDSGVKYSSAGGAAPSAKSEQPPAARGAGAGGPITVNIYLSGGGTRSDKQLSSSTQDALSFATRRVMEDLEYST